VRVGEPSLPKYRSSRLKTVFYTNYQNSENILVKQNGVLKISDLGSAKVLDQNGKNTSYVVSQYYRAPELILSHSNYTTSIDIWGNSRNTYSELLVAFYLSWLLEWFSFKVEMRGISFSRWL
jgi:serine/threonine protein kinase